MVDRTREMPTTTSKKTVSSVGDNRATRKEGFSDLIGAACIPLVGMASLEAVRSPDEISVYALDLYAVEVHKDSIAEAVVDIAETYPVLGAVLDKIAVTAPLSALIASVITLGVQIAENHKLLPEVPKGAIPGLVPREELENIIREDAKALSSNGA